MTFLLKHIHSPTQTIMGNFTPESSIIQMSKFTLHIYTPDMHLIQEKCFGIELLQISRFHFVDRDYILLLMENGRFVTLKYENGFKTVALKWFKEGNFFRINCSEDFCSTENKKTSKRQKGFLKINEHEFAIFNIFERKQSKIYNFVDVSPNLRNVIDALVLDFYPDFTVCMLYVSKVSKYTKDSFFMILWWCGCVIEDLEVEGIPINLLQLDKIVVVVVEGALVFIKNSICFRFEVDTENAEFIVIKKRLYKFKDEKVSNFEIKQDVFRVYDCKEFKMDEVVEFKKYDKCNLDENKRHGNSFTHTAIKFNRDIFYFDSILFYKKNLFKIEENSFKRIGIERINHNDLILIPKGNFNYERIYTTTNAMCFSSTTNSIIMTERNNKKIEFPVVNFSEQNYLFLVAFNNKIIIYDQNLVMVKTKEIVFSKVVFKNSLIFILQNSEVIIYNTELKKLLCFDGDDFFVGDYFGLLNGFEISLFDLKTIEMGNSLELINEGVDITENKVDCKGKNKENNEPLTEKNIIFKFCIFCEKLTLFGGKNTEKDDLDEKINIIKTEIPLVFNEREEVKDLEKAKSLMVSFFGKLESEDENKQEKMNLVNDEDFDYQNRIINDEIVEAFSADELKKLIIENKMEDEALKHKYQRQPNDLLQNDKLNTFYDNSSKRIDKGKNNEELIKCTCKCNNILNSIQVESINDIFAVKTNKHVTLYKIFGNKAIKLSTNIYKVESLFVDDANLFVTGEISFCFNKGLQLSSQSIFTNENFCIKNGKIYEIKNKFDMNSRSILRHFLGGVFSLIYIQTKPAIFKKEVIDPNEEEQIVLDDRIGADTLRFSISLSNHVEPEKLKFEDFRIKNVELEDTIELLENEFVESINIFPLKEVSSQTVSDFLVVGTAFVKGEDHQFRGRLLVFEIIDVVPEKGKTVGRRHKLLSFESCKGPVLDCCALRGNIAACVGTRVLVYEIDRNEGLNAIAFHDMQILSVKIKAVKNYFYVADINNGLYFFYFQTRPFRIHLLAQTSKTCIENLGIVVVKNSAFLVCVGDTVKVFSFDSEMTMFVQRLEFRGESFTLKNVDFSRLEGLYDKMCSKDYFGTDKNELKANVRLFSILNEFMRLSLEQQNRLLSRFNVKKEDVLSVLHDFLFE